MFECVFVLDVFCEFSYISHFFLVFFFFALSHNQGCHYFETHFIWKVQEGNNKIWKLE